MENEAKVICERGGIPKLARLAALLAHLEDDGYDVQVSAISVGAESGILCGTIDGMVLTVEVRDES